MNNISSAIAHAHGISSDKDVWLRCRLRLELPLVPETLVLSSPLAGLQLQGLSQDVCCHCALPLRQEASPSLPAALVPAPSTVAPHVLEAGLSTDGLTA